NDRCVFSIKGGWQERYRFLVEIDPVRRSKIAASLFGYLRTDKIKLESAQDSGFADVYWIETETGNYVAEGFCSKNSDTYGVIIANGSAKPRIHPATFDGSLNGMVRQADGALKTNLVLLTPENWERIK